MQMGQTGWLSGLRRQFESSALVISTVLGSNPAQVSDCPTILPSLIWVDTLVALHKCEVCINVRDCLLFYNSHILSIASVTCILYVSINKVP